MIFFQMVLIGVLGDVFLYIDELLLVSALLLIFIPAVKDKSFVVLTLWIVVIFILFHLLSFHSWAYRSLVTIVMQNLIHFKAFIFFLLLYNYRQYINVVAIVHWFLGLTILGVIANLVIGIPFINALDAEIQFRNNMLRPVGIQASTGNLGITLAFLYLFYLFRFHDYVNYRRILFYTVIFSLMFLVSSVRTPFVALLLAFLFIFGLSLKRMIVGAVIAAVIAPIFLTEYMYEMFLLTVDDLDTFDDPEASEYIRGLMIYFSFVIAESYFPFGTGAASFGTFLSDNSPVYQELGISTLYFFQEKTGIYDSNLASLLGEFGVLGISLFLFIYYRILRLTFEKGVPLAFVFTFGVMVWFYSAVAPIFVGSYPALLVGLVLVAVISQTEKNAAKQARLDNVQQQTGEEEDQKAST